MSICQQCGDTLPLKNLLKGFCCGGCETVWHTFNQENPPLQASNADMVAHNPDFLSSSSRANGVAIHKTRFEASYGLPQSSAPRNDRDVHELHLIVEGIHCGNCIVSIENALQAVQPTVLYARVNMSTKRLVVRWQGPEQKALELIDIVGKLGYKLIPYDPEKVSQDGTRQRRDLLMRIGVAAIASANVMMIATGIWAGNIYGTMGEFTRSFLHWLSAAIALPAALYSGMPFYKSAWNVLLNKRTNMDVPIAVSIIGALILSIHETIVGGNYAYFDAAVSLIFLLLIGRYLDLRTRDLARDSAAKLLAAQARAITIIEDGRHIVKNIEDITPGMIAFISSGEKIAADGVVLQGSGLVDTSIITGESIPKQIGEGGIVHAGTLNISGSLTIKITKIGENTILNEIIKLMEVAEQSKAKYVRIADRIASYYTLVVHSLALSTFIGWLYFGSWHTALLNSIAVLIITCPCALGLAVPMVQVVASGRLMRRGILVKTSDALEKISDTNYIVFDKTGSLTKGQFVLQNQKDISSNALKIAASMAKSSKHPLSRAIYNAYHGDLLDLQVEEISGFGLRATYAEQEIKLGSQRWCDALSESEPGLGEVILWLRIDDQVHKFDFADELRDDATESIAALKAMGYPIEILSGDIKPVVAMVAGILGIERYQAEVMPKGKYQRLVELKEQGYQVLMVGDGLNDAAALAVAHVSLSPSEALDITQNVADAIFQGESLSSVVEVIRVAKFAGRLVQQNFILAFVYNIVTIPLAIFGFVTPMIAAIAMSSSSILVTLNALRLKGQALLHRKEVL